MEMNIDTPHSGSIDVAPDRVIEFPNGLAGFEQLRRFTLFHPETQAGAPPRFFILQSLDDPAIAFNIADPALFGFNYAIDLPDVESALLDLHDPGEAAVVVILLKDGDAVRANLKAPLLLNLRARRGLQHVFSGLDYEIALTPVDAAEVAA